MDKRDFELLAQLRREPLATFERLGALLGISGNSARLRYEAMVRGGVTTPVEALVTAEAIGRVTYTTFLKNVDSPATLRRAFEHPDTFLVTYYPDRDATVSTHARPDQTGKIPSSLRDLGFDVTSSRPAPWRSVRAGQMGPVSDLDLRMLQALVVDPRAPIRRIASLVGCAPKTAVALRESLQRRGLVEFIPLVRLGWAEGLVVYKLTLIGDPLVCAAVAKSNPNMAMYWPLHDPSGCVLIGHSPSIAAAFDAEREIAGVPGIESSRLAVNSDLVYDRDRVGAMVRSTLEERGAVAIAQEEFRALRSWPSASRRRRSSAT